LSAALPGSSSFSQRRRSSLRAAKSLFFDATRARAGNRVLSAACFRAEQRESRLGAGCVRLRQSSASPAFRYGYEGLISRGNYARVADALKTTNGILVHSHPPPRRHHLVSCRSLFYQYPERFVYTRGARLDMLFVIGATGTIRGAMQIGA